MGVRFGGRLFHIRKREGGCRPGRYHRYMQITLSKSLRIAAIAALATLPFLNAGVRAAVTDTVSGVNLANLDRTCKPCDDFYQFANGGWIKAHPLPAAYPSYGAFTVLAESNRNVLHTILDAASAHPGAVGSNGQKIGDFYASCMNEAAINKAGITPIASQLATIAGYTNLKQLAPTTRTPRSTLHSSSKAGSAFRIRTTTRRPTPRA